MRRFPTDERARGVISASTGNHGQSIAFASQRAGVSCIVAVPRGNNPDKNAAMRAFGATVVEQGKDFDEAREWVEREAVSRRLRYVHSANEPLLIAGVGTYALEIFEDLPEPDIILVPIGGGSGACGCCIVRTGLGKKTRVIGVQAVEADAFARSWRGPQRVSMERIGTFAEGLATRYTFDLTFDILKRELDDIVTLTEAELEEGVRMALRATHNLAEGAGAASLAAAMKLRDQLQGKTGRVRDVGRQYEHGRAAAHLASSVKPTVRYVDVRAYLRRIRIPLALPVTVDFPVWSRPGGGYRATHHWRTASCAAPSPPYGPKCVACRPRPRCCRAYDLRRSHERPMSVHTHLEANPPVLEDRNVATGRRACWRTTSQTRPQHSGTTRDKFGPIT